MLDASALVASPLQALSVNEGSLESVEQSLENTQAFGSNEPGFKVLPCHRLTRVT